LKKLAIIALLIHCSMGLASTITFHTDAGCTSDPVSSVCLEEEFYIKFVFDGVCDGVGCIAQDRVKVAYQLPEDESATVIECDINMGGFNYCEGPFFATQSGDVAAFIQCVVEAGCSTPADFCFEVQEYLTVGENTKTPVPTNTYTHTHTHTHTYTPTQPTPTWTHTYTHTYTHTPTQPTPTWTETYTHTYTPTGVWTPIPTDTYTFTPTNTYLMHPMYNGRFKPSYNWVVSPR